MFEYIESGNSVTHNFGLSFSTVTQEIDVWFHLGSESLTLRLTKKKKKKEVNKLIIEPPYWGDLGV